MNIGHYQFPGQLLVVLLVLVGGLIAVGPLVVVVIVERIELSYQFIGSDLGDFIFTSISVVSLALLLLLFTLVLFLLFLSLTFFFGSFLACCFFFWGQSRLFLEAFVEFFKVVRNLPVDSFLLLDPVASLLQHFILDVVPFNVDDILGELLTLLFVVVMVLLLDHF